MRPLAPALAAALAAFCVAGCSKPGPPNPGGIPVPQISPAERMARDAMLAALVRTSMAATDVDAAVGLKVSVDRGTVRLAGTVRTAAEREKLVAAARRVSGVTRVDDEIRIDVHAKRLAAGDFALAARVTAALAAQTGVNAIQLRASAQDGVVTVTGRLASASLKETALETVRKVGGVKRVVDKIGVGT